MEVHPPPKSVRTAYWLWILAIVTALTELVARFLMDPRGPVEAISASGTELAVRFAAFILLFFLATFMRRGSNIARHLLAVIYGGLGTLSLVIEPIGWIADGGNVPAFLGAADTGMWSIIVSRIVHILAVWGGVFMGYRGDSNAWFRRSTAR